MTARRLLLRPAAALLLLGNACSGEDTTELQPEPNTRREPNAPLEAPRPATPRSLEPRVLPPASDPDEGQRPELAASDDTSPGPDRASSPVLAPTRAALPAATDAGAPAFVPLPCTLRLEWHTLTPSHPDCQALSGVPEARFAVWDGVQLRLLGMDWTQEEARLERTRRCRHQDGQLWRFAEHVALGTALPADRCPDAPVEARYGYDECPLLVPGTVCAAGEPSACQLHGTLRLAPLADEPDPELLAAALATPELEASCRPVGSDPRQPGAEGERCFDGECAAGLFCSRELASGCAPLGDGSCVPAPTSSECDDSRQALCLCSDPPLPLEQLPPFDPSQPAALEVNTCNAHALGLSVVACPAG